MKRMKQYARNNANIILALDVDNHKEAMRWVKLLYPKVKIFKVGLQLYTACGPGIIQDIRKTGAQIFLDLKFNDIPNTMVNAAKEALKYKVAMFTVHSLAGPSALKAVAQICRGSRTKVLAVTLLTSIRGHFLKDLGIKRTVPEEILYLAKMAKRCEVDGVVCSAQEAKILRGQLGRNFIIVTPGIRLNKVARDDQQRTATPEEARKAGANFIVVGRPILEAEDPLQALEDMLRN